MKTCSPIAIFILTVTVVVTKTAAAFTAFVRPLSGNAIPSVSSTDAVVKALLRTDTISTRRTVLSSSNSPISNDDDNGKELNMRELQERIDKQTNQYYELFLSDDNDGPRPEVVNIIVFNPDQEEEQGVHTVEFPKGSGNNIILAFECEKECIRFSQMLKDMLFYDPVVSCDVAERLSMLFSVA